MTEIDLSPAVIDLVLYAGDGVSFRLVVKDGDEVPVPLTGSMIAEIRVKRPDPDPASAEFAIDLTDAADGIVRLSLTGEQTQALAPTKDFKGVWDIQWTPDGAQPRTFCQGKVECGVDVSR